MHGFAELDDVCDVHADPVAFCHANVRFAKMEERERRLEVAPLASETGAQALENIPKTWTGDTIVLIDERGHAVKSRAVAGVLEHLGGVWYLLGCALRGVPRPIADAGYDFAGRIRYRLLGRQPAYCPLP